MQGDILMNGSGPFKCPGCSSLNFAVVFPAASSGVEQGSRGELVVGEESSCFNHPEHAAVAACDECGIYLCALCDLEIEGRHLCPNCLNQGADKLTTVRDKSVLHDEIALSMAILPILIYFIMIVTAPACIIYSCVCWNKVKTPYPRNRWRFILAAILGVLEVVGIILIIVAIIQRRG